MANRGWIKLVDEDFNQLETLRRGVTLRFAYNYEGDPIAHVDGKELPAWTNAFQCGMVDPSELMSCGIGLEWKSLTACFPDAVH